MSNFHRIFLTNTGITTMSESKPMHPIDRIRILLAGLDDGEGTSEETLAAIKAAISGGGCLREAVSAVLTAYDDGFSADRASRMCDDLRKALAWSANAGLPPMFGIHEGAEAAPQSSASASATTGEGGTPAPDKSETARATRSERDWPEDASHENGRYTCICVHCEQHFTGHKRRPVCKACFTQRQPPVEGRKA